MSNRKRRLSQIETDGSESSRCDEPQRTRPRLIFQVSTDSDSFSILSIKNIKDTILDYLVFNDENYDLFMSLADDDYFHRAVWHFSKSELAEIKQRIDESISNQSKRTDINECNATHKSRLTSLRFVSDLYGNIKHVFGESFYKKFANISLSELGNKAGAEIHIDSDCKMLSHSQKHMLLKFQFAAARDITYLFNKKQLVFLNKQGMKIDEVRELELSCGWNGQNRFGVLVTDKISKMSIMLEFDSNYHAQIIVVAMTYKAEEIHTKSMLPSVRQLFIVNKDSVMADDESCHLYIDHCSNIQELRMIELMNGTNNEEFIPLTVHISNTLPSDFELIDHRQSYDITFDAFHKYKPSISEEETIFLKQLNLSPGFQEPRLHGIKRGVLQFIGLDPFDNIYDFKLMASQDPEQSDSVFQLEFVGLCLRDSDEEFMEFRTSEIPKHWEGMQVEGTVSGLEVMIDRFSDQIRTFAVVTDNANININSIISWNDIPCNMTEFRWSFANVVDLRKGFPCLFGDDADSTVAPNRSYKPIEFVFEFPLSAKADIRSAADEIGTDPVFEVELLGDSSWMTMVVRMHDTELLRE